MLEEILKIRKTDTARLSDTSDASSTSRDSAAAAQDNSRDSADDHESSDKSGGVDSSPGGRGSKIIIFSKWPEVLQRISAALHLNGIACAYPSGKRQDSPNDPNAELDHFKTSEQTFVLLLLVDEGAVCTTTTLTTPSY
eukprot:COSAG03_NODE_113_length_12450_cov_625.151810_7_plen_139_part_00